MNKNKFLFVNAKGQSMVEFALVLPILLLFFIGTLQLGMIINDYIALNRAVAEACKYGSTLIGYSSAEVLIVGKLLDSLSENIKKDQLKILSKTNQKYGPYSKNSAGSVLNSNGQAITMFAETLFYRYDNQTPNNFTDDTVISPTAWNCSYVEVKVEYEHHVIVPFADLISASTVILSASSTWPISAYYPTLMPPGQFQLSGGMPIAVNESACVASGTPIVIKGSWVLPGGFGWLDLSVYYNSGTNPNATVNNEINDWITDPTSAPISIIPPQNVYSVTGNSLQPVEDSLAPLIGHEILIPIYDTVGSQGSNGYYHIVGFAVFILNAIGAQDITATYVKTIMKVN